MDVAEKPFEGKALESYKKDLNERLGLMKKLMLDGEAQKDPYFEDLFISQGEILQPHSGSSDQNHGVRVCCAYVGGGYSRRAGP